MTAEGLLKRIYGYDAFRPGQEDLVKGILSGRDVLGIMPTGSGKSVCYQLPSMLLPGLTLVISPLISLMKDQVVALRQMGIPAACLNSSLNDEEYFEVIRGITENAYKLIYIAPERLTNTSFVELCIHLDISLIAVDEAHCISQWGQDFRPGYLKIPEFIRSLPSRPVIGAFTATATRMVRDDILRYLSLSDPVSVTTGFDRPNLSFSVFAPRDKDDALLSILQERPGQAGIIYCATRKNVEKVCDLLCSEGYAATRYHAGLPSSERTANQDDFLFDRRRIMVATNAFGMGIDKSNVSFVIHYNMPQSLEAYYQEAGRAGRDGCDADCILLYSPQDVVTAQWLIEHKDPNPDLSPEEQAEVTEKDLERLKQITFYARSRRCYRWNILHYFGEKAPDKCNNCSNCVSECGSVDITIDAQKILSCIVRTNQKCNAEAIVAILSGYDPEIPHLVPDPESLTTFGIMKDLPESRIHAEIKVLLDKEILSVSKETNALCLTDLASGILFRGRRVTMKMMSATPQKPILAPVNEALLKDLKYLRLRLSSAEQVAAFTLFSDATLMDICRKLPSSMDELTRISGLGTYKVNRFGSDILRVVSKYLPDKRKKIRTRIASSSVSKHRFNASGSEKMLDHTAKADAYAPWSQKEEQQLLTEYRSGLSVRQIAELHNRSTGAILSRLRKLGME